jgi:hypothetical protein
MSLPIIDDLLLLLKKKFKVYKLIPQEPIHINQEKTFCCFCCASAPLSVTVSLPSGGAVPGETILPSVEVENGSNVHIGQIKIAFVKVGY